MLAWNLPAAAQLVPFQCRALELVPLAVMAHTPVAADDPAADTCSPARPGKGAVLQPEPVSRQATGFAELAWKVSKAQAVAGPVGVTDRERTRLNSRHL